MTTPPTGHDKLLLLISLIAPHCEFRELCALEACVPGADFLLAPQFRETLKWSAEKILCVKEKGKEFQFPQPSYRKTMDRFLGAESEKREGPKAVLKQALEALLAQTDGKGILVKIAEKRAGPEPAQTYWYDRDDSGHSAGT